MGRLATIAAIVLLFMPVAVTGAKASNKVTYSDFAFVGFFDVVNANGITLHVARFVVTRTLPDDNDPVAWVYATLTTGEDFAAPVVWGLYDSPSGVADLQVPEGAVGTAWLTVTPQRPRHNDPSLGF